VTITQTALVGDGIADNVLTYTITVKNIGDMDLSGVTVTDQGRMSVIVDAGTTATPIGECRDALWTNSRGCSAGGSMGNACCCSA
jgi:uncharacterized repeat protein (TIGR01451 family)